MRDLSKSTLTHRRMVHMANSIVNSNVGIREMARCFVRCGGSPPRWHAVLEWITQGIFPDLARAKCVN